MLIECLSTWNLWKQFHDIFLIITSACVIHLAFVMSQKCLWKTLCFVVQNSNSHQKKEETLVSDANLTQTFIVLNS